MIGRSGLFCRPDARGSGQRVVCGDYRFSVRWTASGNGCPTGICDGWGIYGILATSTSTVVLRYPTCELKLPICQTAQTGSSCCRGMGMLWTWRSSLFGNNGKSAGTVSSRQVPGERSRSTCQEEGPSILDTISYVERTVRETLSALPV